MSEKIKQWFRAVYHQLVEIDDAPSRKALGLGLGVFLGNFPGMGPIASVVTAYIFRVNRAAALVGSFATNTWLSFVTLALAVKVGAFLTGKNQEQLQQSWGNFRQDFHFKKIFERETFDLIVPVLIGFCVVSFVIGLCVAGIAYVILCRKQKKRCLVDKTGGRGL
ncbi:MAG: hypothetical protein A2Z88_01105 [Omnitrophica WOR_2 bacterium GWA2_47_8]|nr:MAG: hypothetical protein A2Z88_01105 [Omnitrophica WOR_2 bacterium GWA2_47_8]